jgi:hypothetical protein
MKTERAFSDRERLAFNLSVCIILTPGRFVPAFGFSRIRIFIQ